MNNPLLSIYVLNWNQPDITIECVQSLIAQKGNIPFEIIVIDNGSTDDSIQIFQGKIPQVEIIKNPKNLGFQGGMNVGILRALQQGTEFVLLLNNDTLAEPDMIEKLFRFFPEEAHLVSPGIYYHSNPDFLCSLGYNLNPFLLEATSRPRSRYKQPQNDIIKYDFLPAHAWLIKTCVFKEIGLLDEMFFPLYYDDLDFCLRLKKKEYNLYLIPKAKIFHKVSMSVGGKNSAKERYLMARNSGYYFRKHMSIWNAPFIILFRFGSALFWTFRLIKQKNFAAIGEYWKGLKDGWFGKLPIRTESKNP